MLSVSLWILTFILILVSLFLILIVLAQKTKDGGMGAALGGGAAEAAFGAETSNVLTRMTKYAAILFFVLAFVLYLGRVYERNHARSDAGNALPTIAAPAAVAPVVPPPAGVTTAPAPGADATPAPALDVQVPAPATPTPAAPAAPAPAPEATKK